MHIEEINQTLFNQMPTTMYHGCVGNQFTRENFKSKIKIFDSVDEYNSSEKNNHKQTMGRRISRQTYGRTNLDAAYHGFYLTPNYQEAYKWATKIKGLPGQIIQVKIDKEKIREHCKVLCFPNEEWLKFIINNRKKTTIRNLVKCSYTLRADGKMRLLNKSIQNLKEDLNKEEFIKNLINPSLRKYLNEKIKLFLLNENISSGRYLQLCISSSDLLNAIEIVDIINIEEGDISYE